MKKEFLKNFQVGGAPLPDAIIDAILQEHTRDLDTARANPGANGEGGKTFTQDDVNRIVSERLARERDKQPQDDEREKALKARESRLDCRDYLDSKKYPAALLDVLDSSDVEKFKAAADKLAKQFPAAFVEHPTPPPYAPGTGAHSWGDRFDPVADAFKPPKY